jgi:hypothetical protein
LTPKDSLSRKHELINKIISRKSVKTTSTNCFIKELFKQHRVDG